MKIALTTWRIRSAAVAGALALGLTAVAAFGAPASAVELGPNIDPDQTGSINLHKYAQPEGSTGLPNDGSELDPAQLGNLTPLQGVSFSLQRVGGIDLTSSAGWDTVEDLTAGDVLADAATYPLTAAGTGATDGGGNLTFPTLSLGVYLVTETDPGNNPIAQPAAPFLVTMPMPTGNNTFLYDVNVYPKNAITNVTKTVDDASAAGLGDTVTWSINGTVPYLASTDPLNRFAISDALDARLEHLSSAVSAVDAAGAPLTMDPSYSTITESGTGGTSTVQMVSTAAGLAFLQAHQGAVVTLSISTRVRSIGDGTIENRGTLAANDAEPSAEAVTDWGALRIFKFAGTATPANGLNGAQFKVFTTAADAGAATNPVEVNGVSTFTTDATGKVLLGGLRARDYYVVETVAPAGYVLDATPHPVTVVAGSTADPVVLNVENTQVAAWTLPFTGGNGKQLFIAGGVALILLALGSAVVISRRRSRAVTVEG